MASQLFWIALLFGGAAVADTSAPVWPDGAQLTVVKVGTVPQNMAPPLLKLRLSWPAASDDVGVVRYAIYRKGQLVEHSTALTFSIETELANDEWRVEAGDAAGNWSANGPSAIYRGSSILRVIGTKGPSGEVDSLGNGVLPNDLAIDAAFAAAAADPSRTLTLSSPKVVGPLDVEVVRDMVLVHERALRGCFGAPSATVRADTSWTVKPNGRVVEVKVVAPMLGDGVTQCLVSIISGWTFPTSAGSTRVTQRLEL